MPYGFNENKGKFMLNNYLNRSAIGNAPNGVYCFNADKSKFNLTPYLNGTVTTAVPNGVYCFDDDGSKYDLSGFLFVNKIVKPARTSSTVTYSGSSVAAPISGYSGSTMTMSGDTSATNVGTYTTYISPKTGYVWNDGTTNTLTFTWQITPMKIAKPYLSTTSYDYSGSTFTPTIVNYNSARMTKSGTDSASAVGTYKIYISPKSNYAWTDGSTSQVTLAWEIKNTTVDLVLGNYYIFGGKEWLAYKKEGNCVSLQCAENIGALPWLGYVMPQYGNGHTYTHDIDGQDISSYNSQLSNLYNSIKSAEYKNASYGSGLYLNSQTAFNFDIGYKYSSFTRKLEQIDTTYRNGAWTGTCIMVAPYYNEACSVIVIGGNFGNGQIQQSRYALVMPAFNVDTTKIRLSGSTIYVK